MSRLDKRGIEFGTTGNQVNAAHLPANRTPTNYTPTDTTVKGHLDGIDTALLSTGGGGDIAIFESDLSFDGIVTQKDTDVSSTITDARKAQIQLLDNANNYERIYCKLLATSSSNVRVATNVPLPSGNYKLLVYENVS